MKNKLRFAIILVGLLAIMIIWPFPYLLADHKEEIQKRFDIPGPVADALDRAFHVCGPIMANAVQTLHRDGSLFVILVLYVKENVVGMAIHELDDGEYGKLHAVRIDIPPCISMKWKREGFFADVSVRKREAF